MAVRHCLIIFSSFTENCCYAWQNLDMINYLII